MIIVVKKEKSKTNLNELIQRLKDAGYEYNITNGKDSIAIGVIGDTSKIDVESIRAFDIVENVTRIQEPYINVSRKNHPLDTIIDVNGIKIGGEHFQVIAGPCSVENEKQIISVAKAVKESGASFLRGGAFKPRTSPYAFQGLGVEGLHLLYKAKKETGMPIVTEIMDSEYLDEFYDVDIIQVGARNMQNFDLLRKLGRINKPVLLKRGLSATIEEWLMSAEYIMSEGNPNVILCERGIRTFETTTRSTLDISAVPFLKEKTHLPVIVDPSHASGVSKYVKPLALAAISAGADGMMIEVHNNPTKALCDGAQALKPDEFDELMKTAKKLMPIFGKKWK